MILNRFSLICIFFLSALAAEAQQPIPAADNLPPVFLIGEYEHAFEQLSEDYNEILLTVCGDDMDYAYEQWMDMLSSLEDYSDRVNYDLKGLKLYLYVFWNADGSIAHFAYFPKPNSKNLPIDELTAVFRGFVKEYRMPVKSDNGFSHYASASFPVFFKPEYRVHKD